MRVTSFSYKPLRLCFLLSGLSCFAVVVLGILAVLAKNPINTVGFGVSSAIFLLGCFMFFCLGILGEYLGRVHDEVRSRPLSIINKVYAAEIPAEIEVELGKSDYIPGIAQVA